MKKFSIASLCIGLSSIMLLMSAAPAEAQKRRVINIGTGGPTGVYFAAGNAICKLVNTKAARVKDKGKVVNLRCSAPSTDGSIYNIEKISEGVIDFAIAQSDWQYHAYQGSSKFKGKKVAKLRSVFCIHPEPFQLIVVLGSNIRSWSDLKGKRVNIGDPGSGHRGTMEELMQAYGTSVRDFRQATELTSTEQSKALCDGKIDAYGYTVGVPNVGVAIATDNCGAQIIDLNTSVEKALVGKHPYYAFATKPKGTYKTSDKHVTTFGVMATLVTSAAVDAQVVYEVTRSVMENLTAFRKLHPAFRTLTAKNMSKAGLSAPLHPGAVKYFKEKGLL